MVNALVAALLYFLLVFALGFMLGTLRVLVLAPAFGELVAVLLELPIILGAAWIICGRLIRRLAVSPRLGARLVMGGGALALLLAAELVLAVWVFGNSLADQLVTYRLPHNVIGLAGQVLYGLLPIARMYR